MFISNLKEQFSLLIYRHVFFPGSDIRDVFIQLHRLARKLSGFHSQLIKFIVVYGPRQFGSKVIVTWYNTDTCSEHRGSRAYTDTLKIHEK